MSCAPPSHVSIPPIRCAVCNKIVDRWKIEENYEAYTIHIAVWCHGERDTCEIQKYFIMEAGADALARSEAVAFARKQLEKKGGMLAAPRLSETGGG